MYGRNSSSTNIFNRNSSTLQNSNNNSYSGSGNNANPYRSNNSYSNSYGSGSSYGNYSNGPRIGSNRLKHNPNQISRNLQDIVKQWKSGGSEMMIPSSISCRYQTIHLSPTQIRIEDYYLIRKNKIQTKHQRYIRDAIASGSFNPQLMKDNTTQNLKQMSFFNDKEPDIQTLRQYKENFGSNSVSTNQTSYNSYSSYSNDRYGSSNNNSSYGSYGNNNNSSSNNIFSSNNGGNNGSRNIFNNSSNNNGSSYSSYNNYSNNNSSSGNNIFKNNNSTYGNSNNSGSNNIFSNNNNNSSYNNNNSSSNPFNRNNNNSYSSNNIFSNNNSSNNNGSNYNTRSSNNIFNNNSNNNNSSSGNNIFNRNNNSNSGNIFSNNNSGNNNSGNPFMKNNNSSGGNNIFNNNNGGNNSNGNNIFSNNRTGNNIFSNNNNNGGGNNIFSNGNNSQSNNIFNRNNNNGNNGYNNNFGNNLGNNDFALFMYQQTNLMTGIYSLLANNNKNGKPINSSFGNSSDNPLLGKNYILPVNTLNADSQFSETQKKLKEYQRELQFREFRYRDQDRYSSDQPKMIIQFIQKQEKQAKSTRNQNLSMMSKKQPYLSTGSNILTNSQNKMTMSAFNNSKAQHFISQNENISQYQLFYQIKTSYKEQPDLVNIVKGEIIVKDITSSIQYTRLIQKKLNQDIVGLKSGSQLSLSQPEFLKQNIYKITGKLIQKKINLPLEYSFQPSLFKGFKVEDLEISNQYGTITWTQPINITGIDFSKGSLKILKEGCQCSINQLNKPCLLKLKKIPQSLSKYRNEPQKALKKLNKFFNRINNQRGGKFEATFINFDPPTSWLVRIDCFPRSQSQQFDYEQEEEQESKSFY